MGAICVQRFDDSLNSAIHITYRISLRSSSMPEPRDPLLKVLTYLVIGSEFNIKQSLVGRRQAEPRLPGRPYRVGHYEVGVTCRGNVKYVHMGLGVIELFNDPSAGSPTETLLRLLLPLNDRVWITFRP
jgi:hypothetical protein